MEELLDEWKESIIVAIYKECDKTDCSNYSGNWYLRTKFHPIFLS
jgi:hypothetical protein